MGGKGEEFPRFTEFWLVRPQPGDTQATVYALMDSPRATGAYRFDIQPGAQTVTTVRARIFVRGGSAGPIKTLGIAPLTSMFLFGENQPRKDDFRPEVHDSDGLMVATGEGEWLWRPLQNPRQVLVTSFATTNPKGFGLMQRDRQWSSYEDVEAAMNAAPAPGCAPCTTGAPAVWNWCNCPPDETHDNVVAYWVPQQLPAPAHRWKSATSWHGRATKGWAATPPSAWAAQSRKGVGYAAKRRSPAHAGAVRGRFHRPGIARPEGRRARQSSGDQRRQRPRAGKRRVPQPGHRPVAHDAARGAPAQRPAH